MACIEDLSIQLRGETSFKTSPWREAFQALFSLPVSSMASGITEHARLGNSRVYPVHWKRTPGVVGEGADCCFHSEFLVPIAVELQALRCRCGTNLGMGGALSCMVPQRTYLDMNLL